MNSESVPFEWICVQLGAREHYSIPEVLHASGRLHALITDQWNSSSDWLSHLPGPTGAKLKSRHNAAIPDDKIRSFSAKSVLFEVTSRLQKSGGWEAIIDRNDWFQRTGISALHQQLDQCHAPVVFAYSYAARQFLTEAKQRGVKTVLGQIDPGPFEMQLVQELTQQAGLGSIDQPPPSYWENWRHECDLADKIVVNSQWSQKALINEGIDRDKIEIIELAFHRPTDANPVAAQPVDEFSASRPLKVLFLGQVIVRKGVVELIGAIKQLQSQPIEWTIVGGGDQNFLDQLSRFSNVSVVGQVERPQVVEYYQNSDLFILPTHSDGYALTQLEAAAFGLPIIASEFCGNVVREGVDGIRLNRVHEDDIVSAISGIISNPEQLNAFRENQLAREFRTLDDLSGDLAGLERALRQSR